MQTDKVSSIFDVRYGNSLSLSDCIPNLNGVNFVSRTEKNNGVSGKVTLIKEVQPNPKNTISVAVGGSVMSSFLQKEPYYTGYHVLVLHPKTPLSDNEMLYYCMCLKANKYRYSYGRQANKTLLDLEIPTVNSIPSWVNETKIKEPTKEKLLSETFDLNKAEWSFFDYTDIFDNIEKCKCNNASLLLEEGEDIFYIGAKKNINGFMNKVKINKKLVSKGNAIVFIGDGQGSVGYATYQQNDFIGSTTLVAGYSKYLNVYNALFLITIFDMERYRYSFGRKYGKAVIQQSKVKLPTRDDQPDWQFMENYIRSLPYSSNL